MKGRKSAITSFGSLVNLVFVNEISIMCGTQANILLLLLSLLHRMVVTVLSESIGRIVRARNIGRWEG